MMSARSRVSVIARHLNTIALTENILFPVLKVAPAEVSGYTIQVDVHHDYRIIDFFTRDMCHNEKTDVYLKQKRMMREMYPEYIITEKHN
jgi:hypothetical protein